MSDYKVNFREMKSRVGIDDIAYALGYRLAGRPVSDVTSSWYSVKAVTGGIH